MPPLSRPIIRKAATNIPWTTNFDHLQSFPRHWLKPLSWRDPKLKAARVQDRIKWWNIVPGDQIRVLGDPAGVIHEVLNINRISSRVSLKRPQTATTDSSKPAPNKNVHYSKCQLFIGNHEYPADGTEAPKVQPVFAKRIATSQPRWHRLLRRWDWKRFAVATVPRLPDGKIRERIGIPWPRVEHPETPKPNAIYDTPADVVKAITYKLAPLPQYAGAPAPPPPDERVYLRSILKPEIPFTEASAPMELHLVNELSPPHSRAKIQKRWQERQQYKKDLLLKLIAEERKQLKKHKSMKEARKWALFKWKEQLEAERKAEVQRRAVNRGEEARSLRRQQRNARKERKARQKLSNMVLAVEPNQVLPPSMTV
ncbi:hypothetical protein JAAARDRAFT_167639 [Jaapia argillacea MUCL 33604]|uniref:Uncharacterized protein n=1 Tax=Jaapia argillacea MUCL 33604 TaxID=933084 RepID=A0A067QCV6_9AGAM|nr:hypothetical protein JAAARDRAFT_167639 [Jaapia argillacea MUCL 33604]